MRFFARSTLYALGKLCRQSILLAGLALLCLLVPGRIGAAMEEALSAGVEFGGITLALSTGEDDRNLPLIRNALNAMEDLNRYVTFVSMEQQEALDALEAGEVTAVLHVPWDMVRGVMSGENPDFTVYVNEEQPLEGMLLYWVGQSAADMLASVQAGIYAVQDSYAAEPVEGLSRSQVIDEINWVYINWTLNRQTLFDTTAVRASDTLPVGLHYQLSLLAWLALSMAPVFSLLFTPDRIAARKRLRSLGISHWPSFLSDGLACTALLFLMMALPLALLPEATVAGGLVAAAVFALFCGSFGCLCCLLTGDSARCGGLSFLLGLVALALSGGIVPPVMLPETLRTLGVCSPITWLRSVAAAACGYEGDPAGLFALALTTAVMILLGSFLYRRRMEVGEVAP